MSEAGVCLEHRAVIPKDGEYPKCANRAKRMNKRSETIAAVILWFSVVLIFWD